MDREDLSKHWFKKGYDSRRYTGSKPEEWSFDYKDLAKLFNVSTSTISRWVCRGKLKMDLEDVIDKYNHRYKLDGRRKENRYAPDHLPQDTHEH